MNFSAVITPDTLSFVGPDGTSYSYQESMSFDLFHKACDYIRKIQNTSNENDKNKLIDHLIILLSPSRNIPVQSNGRIVIEHGTVKFDGKPVHSVVTETMLWGIAEGYGIKSYMAFLEKLDENPSRRAVKELFAFIERNKLVIDEDGYILAYKKVQENFYDIHSGTIDNSIGNIVKVKRNTVDDNFGKLCSEGLHCCAFDYLPTYASSHNNRVLLIKIHPKDVVSFPEYGGAKMRVCEYEVLREVPYNHGDDDVLKEDFLTKKPIWSRSDIFDHSGVEIGNEVQYIGEHIQYNKLTMNEIYTVAKVMDWGGSTYVSLEGFPDNDIFLLNEFRSLSEEDVEQLSDEYSYSFDTYDDEEDDTYDDEDTD